MAKESISKYLYLRAIRALGNECAKVRNVDIANMLSYSRPSVTNAMKRLENEGLIHIDKKAGIVLTDEGLEIADKAAERNVILQDFFCSLGASEAAAIENARRIEPLISDELMELIQIRNTGI